jgi:ATP-dependent DNA helicase RecG
MVLNIRETIRMPESKTLEFKRDISSYEKIVKTIIAFANSAGGKIIVGVDDNKNIVGVDDPLDMEERLTNIIFDSITPRILPSIEIIPIDDKQLLAVEVFPCGNMPYFYRKLGRENGVFVRLGSSTRIADRDLINELERFANGIAFDSLPCYSASIDDLDIAYIREQFPDKKHNDEQLLKTLKTVVEEQNKLIPTNGGIILFAKERTHFFDNLFIQCARFKGKTKEMFIDHIEMYEKPLEAIKQIEIFLKKHALRGFALDGMKRVDKWNIPLEALREVVINAIVHADYSVKGVPMRIAIYDDRIDVENAGNFLPGLTIEEIISGTSKIRNPMIVRVFKELGLVEQWGSGIPRIFGQITDLGLSTPKMEEISGRVRTTVEVENVGVNEENVGVNEENVGVNEENVGVNGGNVGLNEIQEKIMLLLAKDVKITLKIMAEKLNITEKTIERNIKKLRAIGLIERVGSDKSGEWKILQKIEH